MASHSPFNHCRFAQRFEVVVLLVFVGVAAIAKADPRDQRTHALNESSDQADVSERLSEGGLVEGTFTTEANHATDSNYATGANHAAGATHAGTNAEAFPARQLPARGRRVNRGESGGGAQRVVRRSGEGQELSSRSTSWTGLWALGVVLIIMGVAYWAIKRFVPGAQQGENEALRVIARTAVTPKQSVVLISVGNRIVMVGVSPEQMTVLADVSDERQVAELAFLAGANTPRLQGRFDTLLGKEKDQFNEAVESESPVADRERGLSDLLSKLRSMQS